MRELITEYMSTLLALELCCKDGHYQCKGIDFRQLHEIFDTILDGLSEDRDNIQEVFFMARGEAAVSGKEVAAGAIAKLPEPGKDNITLISNVKTLVEASLELLNKLNDEKLTMGDNDLFAPQARSLQQKLGFLERSLQA